MFHNARPSNVVTYKADSGAATFQARYVAHPGDYTKFSLTAKDQPEKELYQFHFGSLPIFKDKTKEVGVKITFRLPRQINHREYVEFHLTWYNNVIQLISDGLVVLEYRDCKIASNNIGYIQFMTRYDGNQIDWIYDSAPNIPLLPIKIFKGGNLHWENVTDGHLPEDAFIGGFEDEPIYISRATHNGSLCPGKYVPSKQETFVPWGGVEHVKTDFQILCGYNAIWMKTRGNLIPENAFVAGYSEVRREPLYIGRAMINDHLIVGKVHTLYHTCYLPYNGKEVEVQSYEILVKANATPRAVMSLQNVQINPTARRSIRH